jgi:hypothetical protein
MASFDSANVNYTKAEKTSAFEKIRKGRKDKKDHVTDEEKRKQENKPSRTFVSSGFRFISA